MSLDVNNLSKDQLLSMFMTTSDARLQANGVLKGLGDESDLVAGDLKNFINPVQESREGQLGEATVNKTDYKYGEYTIAPRYFFLRNHIAMNRTRYYSFSEYQGLSMSHADAFGRQDMYVKLDVLTAINVNGDEVTPVTPGVEIIKADATNGTDFNVKKLGLATEAIWDKSGANQDMFCVYSKKQWSSMLQDQNFSNLLWRGNNTAASGSPLMYPFAKYEYQNAFLVPVNSTRPDVDKQIGSGGKNMFPIVTKTGAGVAGTYTYFPVYAKEVLRTNYFQPIQTTLTYIEQDRIDALVSDFAVGSVISQGEGVALIEVKIA